MDFVDPEPMAGWAEMAAHLAWLRLLAMKQALMWVSHHTGVPAVVLLAVAIVAGWRLGRRAGRFTAEVGIVLMLLFILTKIGVLKL